MAAFSLEAYPIDSEKVTLFVAFLGVQGLSLSTIESYLSALRHYCLIANPGSLTPSFRTPFMSLLLRGIKRTNLHTQKSVVRLPITISLMHKMKAVLAVNPDSYLHVLLWAACCVGFFGFLRCGEFLIPDQESFVPSKHLSLADIWLDKSMPQWCVHARIKCSKTDQFFQGATVILGSTGQEVCPVSALLDYLGKRGGSPGPLFRLENGAPLRRCYFVSQVQSILSTAGVHGPNFNGHSFRIGAATTASAVGIPEATIKVLGRWKSMAYQQYVRPSNSTLAGVAPCLLSSASPANQA